MRCLLSYSRRNAAEAVWLKSNLVSNGVEAWRGLDDIPLGANWDREIETAIDNCTHVLFLASESSMTSDNVITELSYASERQKTVIPLMFQDVRLPFRINRAHALDFMSDQNEGLKTLLTHLHAYMANTS